MTQAAFHHEHGRVLWHRYPLDEQAMDAILTLFELEMAAEPTGTRHKVITQASAELITARMFAAIWRRTQEAKRA